MLGDLIFSAVLLRVLFELDGDSFELIIFARLNEMALYAALSPDCLLYHSDCAFASDFS